MDLVEGLLLANLLLLIALAVWQIRIRRSLREIQLATESDALTGELPEHLLAEIRKGQPVLSIHVLNPMQLAVDKHWLAGVAGRVTPGIVRRIVASEAARIIRLELPKYGVEANVEVLRGK